MNPSTKDFQINVSELARGVYVLIIQNNNFTVSRKVVVIR
jgi:hypothetical protein